MILSETVTPLQPGARPPGVAAQRAVLQSPATVPYTTSVELQALSPQALDPHWMYDTASYRVVAQVYETLLMHRGDDPAAHVPMLATGWEASPDARTYTLTIRSGITFHRGAP
jgi:peptide/nickel transport system substrate-binding protein